MPRSSARRPDEARGLLFGAGAYALWGLFPLYWPLLAPAAALEILAHRIVWSLGFVGALLAVRPRPGWFAALRARPGALPRLTAAAVVLSVNWLVYIWAINNDQVVETSLGYFINPLVTVLLGVALLRERLRGPQWVAVAVAAVAVLVLTVDYGRLPWIALTLAGSFAVYGLLKKRVGAGAVETLTVETAVLFLPALAYLAWLEVSGAAVFGHAPLTTDVLLAGAGIVTAVPLLLFGGAATRIPLTVLGLLQYIAPVLQFLIGVLVRHEPMPASRLVGFSLVWAALVLLTVDALTSGRRARLVTEPC
ncbi:MAG TPA: EamA family transporter RarD [Mycobacteriales bacterium]|nr:EamA family transporter RarD [Mycobacteriales bacterium]